MSQSDFKAFGSLMNPRSIAILGASDNPERIGGRSLGYMLQRRFDGDLWPVNPNRSAVQGLKAFALVGDLPSAPDVAILALAAKLVPDAIDDLAAIGTKSAVIFSSGFAEVDVAGTALQTEVIERARRGGIRILGPNTLGLVNPRINFWGTFTSTFESGWPKPGRIGIASQSGAYGAHMLSSAISRGLGVSGFITTGNEADLTTADAIGWLAEDDGTDVIVAYLEGIRDGAKLVDALDAARSAHKPVIVMKAGRSKLGAAAAQSHTASLAGNDAVADAVLREMGAIRIESTQQALDFAQAAMARIYPVGNTLGVLTVSGGAGILIADDAEQLGLPMPEMPMAAQSELTQLLSFAATRNPVDCTAQALNQLELVGEFGLRMVEAGGYKSILIFFSQAGGAKSIVSGLRAELQKVLAAAKDRLCVLSVLGPEDVIQQYQNDGWLVYDDPARAVAAIAAMGRLGDSFAQVAQSLPTSTASTPILTQTPNEAVAKSIFASAGVTVAEERLTKSKPEALAAAEAIGFPVVMKIVSPDILHKTEIGGVLTNVDSPASAEAGFDTLIARAKSKAPTARLDGVLVARKIVGGIECIMGITRDPVFGPIAMFGLGGIHVEVLKDVVLRRCPFGHREADAMIRSIRSFALLEGVRGAAPVDLAALSRMLSCLSQLAVDLGPNLKSIDANPVIATQDGAWAVDAAIEIELQDAADTQAPQQNGGNHESSDLHLAQAVRSR